MVYVTVKEETEDKLYLTRQPSNNSWAMLVGFCAFGLGAAYYGNDYMLWKVTYVTMGVFVGISCMEDWEECEFNKSTGEIRLKKYSMWDLILTPFTGSSNTIVAHLPDVVGVRVEEEKVNYFGTSHQVVLVFNTGMSLGITESFTFSSSKEHTRIAEKVRKFLGLPEQPKVPTPTSATTISTTETAAATEAAAAAGDSCTGDISSSDDTADDFEQIDKSELMDEIDGSPVSTNTDGSPVSTTIDGSPVSTTIQKETDGAAGDQ